jgi:hypothetical protein
MPKWSQLPWGNIVAATPGVLALFLQWWRGRKSLTVKIHDPGDRGLFPPILEVIAVNNGFRPLHLEQVSIVLKGGEEIVWAGRFTTHDDLPCELLEGKKFTASIMVNDLSDFLAEKGCARFARIRGQVIDEGGRVYRGRWWRYRMRKWVLGEGATSI